MKPWVQFGGWAAFMVVVACVVGAAAKDHGLFGPNSSTIIAGVIQAAATGGAIFTSVHLAATEARRREDAAIEEARRRAIDLQKRAWALATLAANRINGVAEGLGNPTVDAEEILSVGSEAIDLHVEAMKAFPISELPGQAIRHFESCVNFGILARRSLKKVEATVSQLSARSGLGRMVAQERLGVVREQAEKELSYYADHIGVHGMALRASLDGTP